MQAEVDLFNYWIWIWIWTPCYLFAKFLFIRHAIRKERSILRAAANWLIGVPLAVLALGFSGELLAVYRLP